MRHVIEAGLQDVLIKISVLKQTQDVLMTITVLKQTQEVLMTITVLKQTQEVLTTITVLKQIPTSPFHDMSVARTWEIWHAV